VVENTGAVECGEKRAEAYILLRFGGGRVELFRLVAGATSLNSCDTRRLRASFIVDPVTAAIIFSWWRTSSVARIIRSSDGRPFTSQPLPSDTN
jgi:hypothetical protein